MFKALDSVQSAIVELGIARPKLIMIAALIATIVLLAALVLRVDVDTDPENMLSSSNPVRVLNRSIAEEFGVKNMLVLGIVEEGGVLNAGTLGNAARLVADIETLNGVDPEGMLSFTSVSSVPEGDLSDADVDRIAAELAGDTVLGRRVISEDRTSLAVYIHFIQRYRALAEEEATFGLALGRVYEEPARAITKNALIIALGFVPMFFASLTPYIIVGVFMASIMALSWLASLALLPSVIALFQRSEAQTFEA